MSSFTGHRNADRHHTTGRRAWCHCGEWCYQSAPCACCQQQMADENPCPTCGGTGVAPDVSK